MNKKKLILSLMLSSIHINAGVFNLKTDDLAARLGSNTDRSSSTPARATTSASTTPAQNVGRYMTDFRTNGDTLTLVWSDNTESDVSLAEAYERAGASSNANTGIASMILDDETRVLTITTANNRTFSVTLPDSSLQVPTFESIGTTLTYTDAHGNSTTANILQPTLDTPAFTLAQDGTLTYTDAHGQSATITLPSGTSTTPDCTLTSEFDAAKAAAKANTQSALVAISLAQDSASDLVNSTLHALGGAVDGEYNAARYIAVSAASTAAQAAENVANESIHVNIKLAAKNAKTAYEAVASNYTLDNVTAARNAYTAYATAADKADSTLADAASAFDTAATTANALAALRLDIQSHINNPSNLTMEAYNKIVDDTNYVIMLLGGTKTREVADKTGTLTEPLQDFIDAMSDSMCLAMVQQALTATDPQIMLSNLAFAAYYAIDDTNAATVAQAAAKAIASTDPGTVNQQVQNASDAYDQMPPREPLTRIAHTFIQNAKAWLDYIKSGPSAIVVSDDIRLGYHIIAMDYLTLAILDPNNTTDSDTAIFAARKALVARSAEHILGLMQDYVSNSADDDTPTFNDYGVFLAAIYEEVMNTDPSNALLSGQLSPANSVQGTIDALNDQPQSAARDAYIALLKGRLACEATGSCSCDEIEITPLPESGFIAIEANGNTYSVPMIGMLAGGKPTTLTAQSGSILTTQVLRALGNPFNDTSNGYDPAMPLFEDTNDTGSSDYATAKVIAQALATVVRKTHKGYAYISLANILGDAGFVLSLERSENGKNLIQNRGLQSEKSLPLNSGNG